MTNAFLYSPALFIFPTPLYLLQGSTGNKSKSVLQEVSWLQVPKSVLQLLNFFPLQKRLQFVPLIFRVHLHFFQASWWWLLLIFLLNVAEGVVADIIFCLFDIYFLSICFHVSEQPPGWPRTQSGKKPKEDFCSDILLWSFNEVLEMNHT